MSGGELESIVGDLATWARQQQAGGRVSVHFEAREVEIPEAPPAAARADDPAGSLAALDREKVQGCTGCKLHGSRTNTVFGVGNPEATLLLIGEAPGRDEDLQGEPFVGAAGQLLNKILGAIGFARDDVYIANILKCRPPNNRDPEPDEVQACLPNLLEQLDIIQPKLILTMGRVAAQTLLETNTPLGRLRQRVHDYRGLPLMVTYHPAALLRRAEYKRPTWEDVQKVRDLHAELVAD